MEQYPTIYLYQGATTVVEIDLTDFDLQGGSVVLTVRKKKNPRDIMETWELTESKVHEIVFKDELTATFETGAGKYEYDLMWHIGEERFAQCAPSPIEVAKTVGGYTV